MNAKISRVSKSVRVLLEDEEFILNERDRELLEDCYLTLERIAIKRPLVKEENEKKPILEEKVETLNIPVGLPF